jgi:rubredoxin
MRKKSKKQGQNPEPVDLEAVRRSVKAELAAKFAYKSLEAEFMEVQFQEKCPVCEVSMQKLIIPDFWKCPECEEVYVVTKKFEKVSSS